MLPRVRVLFVSYVFPPVGGAGVQRVTKLVRYLPAHGIRPIVLTAANPSVPVRDESLLVDVAADLRIERCLTLEPSYSIKSALASQQTRNVSHWEKGLRLTKRLASSLLFPDPQVLWLPAATLAVERLGRERPPIDAVFISAPPFSQLLLIPWIRRRIRAPVIIDYRDEWDTTLRAGRALEAGAISRWAVRHLEEALLMGADAITTATEEFRAALLDKVTSLAPERVHYLPNGWDRDDMPLADHPPPADRFRISYVGTVFELTSLRTFIEALRILHRERPDLAKDVDVVVHGRIVPTEARYFEGAERLGIRVGGYLEHRRALEVLARSHLNLCVLNEFEGAERVYPAKIFELMALRRRILVITPNGALERLARQHQIQDVVYPEPHVLAQLLERLVSDWQAGSYQHVVSPPRVERYERRAIAGELATILRRLTGIQKHSGSTSPEDDNQFRTHVAV